jgi:hypothetical protein
MGGMLEYSPDGDLPFCFGVARRRVGLDVVLAASRRAYELPDFAFDAAFYEV